MMTALTELCVSPPPGSDHWASSHTCAQIHAINQLVMNNQTNRAGGYEV